MSGVIHSDVLSGLAGLPADWFHCAVTSPPYWRLRSYAGVAPTIWADGQLVCLGAEADPDSFVRHLVEVFAGVWRVLREDGCLFVNLGETYIDDTKFGGRTGGKHVKGLHGKEGPARRRVKSGMDAGNRAGIPPRFVLAMQAAGWCWRDEVQWIKRSPMPASRSGWRWRKCRVKVERGTGNDQPRDEDARMATGRSCADMKALGMLAQWQPCPGCPKCLPNNGYVLRKGRFATTAAHEPIFMFVKGKEYFCDSEAVSEPASLETAKRLPYGRRRMSDYKEGDAGSVRSNESFHRTTAAVTETRLPRSYLLLSNEPSKEKHFASYPSKIPRFAIEMATSKAGCCPTCGMCHAPVVESVRTPTRPGEATKVNGDSAVEGNRDPERHVASTKVLGYRQSCKCDPLPPVPCRVLDPFAGTGTSLQVANHLGRDATGIEASEQYVEICKRKMVTPLRTKGAKQPKPKPAMPNQQPLFT